jgi:type VI secretion system secreted protein Hcp
MAVDMFLVLETALGEFQDGKKTGQIQIEDFSFSVDGRFNDLGEGGHSGGGKSGRTRFSDVRIFKFVDKSTPVLIGLLSNNKKLKSAKIVVRKAGGKQEIFYTVEMFDALISNFSSVGFGTGNSSGLKLLERKDEDVIQENFTINFPKITITYLPQKADGSVGPEVAFTADFRNQDSGRYG